MSIRKSTSWVVGVALVMGGVGAVLVDAAPRAGGGGSSSSSSGRSSSGGGGFHGGSSGGGGGGRPSGGGAPSGGGGSAAPRMPSGGGGGSSMPRASTAVRTMPAMSSGAQHSSAGGSSATLHNGIGSHTPSFSPGISTTPQHTNVGRVTTGATGKAAGTANHVPNRTPNAKVGSPTPQLHPDAFHGQHNTVGHGNQPNSHGPNNFPNNATHGYSGHGSPAHVNHGQANFHAGPTGMHTGAQFRGGFHPGNHMNPGFHNAGFSRNPGVHVSHLGVAHFGNYHAHLASPYYHPAYFHHSFYHGPWSGHGWGWGWGLGPAYGFGFGWGGGGFGVGWGYGGWGYGNHYHWGPYGYWGRPLGWGFGAWGLGTTVYSCGYYPYYNPYYVVSPTTVVVYNYSNPVAVDPGPVSLAANPNGDDLPDPDPVPENANFEAARGAFRAGDYDAALRAVDAAITENKTDAVYHEFRALTLFALRDYQQAAGVIHSLLAVGPGWDWTTMSGLYADPAQYTEQLRGLEDYVSTHPRNAAGHFLLAYHYMICNHKEASAGQLAIVVQLEPQDRLAGELLKMVQGPPAQPAQPAEPPDAGVTPQPPETPEGQEPEPPAIDKDQLPGVWSAERPDGSKFSLKLSDDGKFSWKFSAPNQKGDEFQGTYTVDGPVLMLQRATGGALPGVVTFKGDRQFNFKMVGGPPEDQGLNFSR
ncbi:MAG: tetratricopeptide repeat protein [Planctomycetes bacterium]|nr:tetratricopeptide repeat protein [Planctomycetota bacterium]